MDNTLIINLTKTGLFIFKIFQTKWNTSYVECGHFNPISLNWPKLLFLVVLFTIYLYFDLILLYKIFLLKCWTWIIFRSGNLRKSKSYTLKK